MERFQQLETSRYFCSDIEGITSGWGGNSNGKVDNFQGLFEGTQLHDQALIVVWGTHTVAESLVDRMNNTDSSNDVAERGWDEKRKNISGGHPPELTWELNY